MEDNVYLVTMFSIIGSVLIWKGVWGLLDMYLPEGTMSEISCIALGASIIYVTYRISLRNWLVDKPQV